MKKLLVGIAICSLASVALAAPTFDINAGVPIQLTPGVPVVVAVHESGSAGIQGMSLNLETLPNVLTDPGDPNTAHGIFQITALDIEGAGTIFNNNTTGANYIGQWLGAPAVLAQGAVTTASGSLSTTGAGIAGYVTLFVPVGTAIGTQGSITTDSPILGSSAMFGAAGADLLAIQGSASLKVVPEPVTGLLLLAGLPLVRRRRA